MEYVCARAAARHDGQLVVGGRMEAPVGADNYLAELAAQIDALNEEGVGGQIAEAAGAALAELLARAEKQVICADRAAELMDVLVTSGSVTEVLNHTAVGAAIALARVEHPRQRAGATVEGGLKVASVWWQWKMLALAKKWQLRAALRQQRWDGVEDPA